MIRVAVVDDETLVRYGFEMILNAVPDFTVVGTSDGSDAVDLVRRTEPDVVLLDIRMPGRSGLDVLTDVVGLGPEVLRPPVVAMLTTFDTDSYLAQALLAGARGFLLKDAAPESLVDAVRVLARGGVVLAPGVDHSALLRATPSTPPPDLSDREAAVLDLLVHGRTNDEIAAALHVSASTVKEDLRSVMRSFGVGSRVELALRAVGSGVVDAP